MVADVDEDPDESEHVPIGVLATAGSETTAVRRREGNALTAVVGAPVRLKRGQEVSDVQEGASASKRKIGKKKRAVTSAPTMLDEVGLVQAGGSREHGSERQVGRVGVPSTGVKRKAGGSFAALLKRRKKL